MIVNVERDGPADRAGVLLGDILVALDGSPLSEPTDVLAALGPDRVGGPISASLLRAGQPTDLTITVGSRPAPRRR